MTLLRHLFLRLPLALLLCFLIGIPPAAFADGVPQLLNYQGRVAVDGQNFTGTGYFKFALVDGGSDQNRTATAVATVSGSNRIASIAVTDGGRGYTTPPAVTIQGTGTGATFTASISNGAVTGITVNAAGDGYAAVPPPVVVIAPPPADVQVSTLWTNDGTGVGTGEKEPDSAVQLPVNKGLYALLLGDKAISGMNPLNAPIFSNVSELYLRVWFSREPSGFTLLTPDQRIAAVGYAMMAEDVKDGSITAAKLAPGAVQMTQLAPELQQQINALIAWQATQVPLITNGGSFALAQDNAASWQILATGSPSSYSASGLPAGLTLDTTTGLISGTPTVLGTFTVSLNATNLAGPGSAKSVLLTVHGPVHVDYASGNDTNAGSTTNPVKTLKHAIALAAAQLPRRSVRVSTATQIVPERITLPEGVSLYGGYTTGATWTRTATRTPWTRTNPLAGQDVIALKAANIAATTVVDQFHISTQDVPATAAGKSSIALWQENCTGLVLNNNEFVALDAMTGATGTAGSPGTAGDDGLNGHDGGSGATSGLGGGSYTNSYGGVGNRGGDGGRLLSTGIATQTAVVDPTGGYSFSSSSSGGGGAAGTNSSGAMAATPGQDGQPASGTAAAGDHALPAVGTGAINATGFAGVSGLSGGSGAEGSSGGGGGGGGAHLSNTFVAGGGGGAGGEGGKGGNGGAGGNGGGGSFALVCLGGQLRAAGNQFTTGNGGAGGTGGTGGPGGPGGQGGAGGNGKDNGQGDESASGGNGGDGITGGPGGGGSGGNGGPSAGIMLGGGATITTNTGSTYTLGSGGAGGLGGLRGGTFFNRAANGNPGTAQNILTLP